MRRLLFIALLLAATAAQAQVVPDSYRRQQAEAAGRFVDSLTTDFTRYLEQLWTDYQLFEGEQYPWRQEPQQQPVLDTVDDTLKTDRQVPFGAMVEPIEAMPYESIATDAPAIGAVTTVTFYGRRLDFRVPQAVASATLGSTRERQVARLWRQLDKGEAARMAAQIDHQRRALYLNDWGLFDLTHQLATTVASNADIGAVLTVYMLNALHYDARLGRAADRLVPLVSTRERLYDVPYTEVDSTRYYAFGDLPRRGRIRTYSQQMDGATRRLDMSLHYSPRLGGALAGDAYRYRLEGRELAIRVNQPLMDFYAAYPQTELVVYANAAVEEAWAAAIERQLRPYTEGQSAVGALNTLLEYVQHGFQYQTDPQQFGREKNFFCEENFYYPANDCEDRAVLFARLTRMLLGLDVVLLEYKDHVATAVYIPGRRTRGHHVELDGHRYMVCDPTCLGAKVGDTSRRYRHKKPNIIKINN